MDFNINNMKKIITLIIIICTTTLIQAQGDLVFNKALILEMNFTDITVPEGKVWKVQGTNGGGIVSVNNSSFTLYQCLWMPEGFSFRKASSGSQATAVNVLEFNLVPLSSSSSIGGTAGSSAEGLEFNKVINIQEQVTTDNYGSPIGSFEIPEGKVWKITKATLNLARPDQLYYLGISSTLMGMFLCEIMIFNSSSQANYNSNPVWINSCTKELVIRRADNSGLTPLRITISAIEYNIPE